MNVHLLQRRHIVNSLHWIQAVSVVLVLLCARAHAQRIGVTYSAEEQTDAALKRLSPESQAVVERLSKIGVFPLDEMRYKTGAVEKWRGCRPR
jgi:hypothetical protein